MEPGLTGMVQGTLLMSDIVGSSRLWESMPTEMHAPLQKHLADWKVHVEQHGGRVCKGLGDGVLAHFPQANDALGCAQAVAADLATQHWPDGTPVEVRIALVTDLFHPAGDDVFGTAVNRLARLLATCPHGTILFDEATYHICAEGPARTAVDAGHRRLRDIPEPIHVFALGGRSPVKAQEADGVRTVGAVPFEVPFVGRAEELEDLRRRVDSGCRLVSLTGPGGMGKTRLARETAKSIAESRIQPVVFVDCSSFAHAEEIAAAILQGLDTPRGAEPQTDLKKALRTLQAFIVLDGYEGLVETAPWLADLISTTEAQFLVTSRSTLRLQAEQEVRLKPLRKGERAWGDRERLFWQCARAANADLTDEARARPVVAEICELLDGMPLLIQLGASRIRHYSLNALLEGLRASRLDLRSDFIDLGNRHSDIPTLVGDSLRLVPPEAAELLGELCVFVGGFTRADAEAVCGTDKERFVGEGLESLRDHSLIQPEHAKDGLKFRVLDSIREYAGQLWPPSAELGDRHCRHYAQKAGSLAQQRATGRAQETNRRLLAEIGNYRRALLHTRATDDRQGAAQLCATLGRSLVELGLWEDLNLLLETARWTEDQALIGNTMGLEGAAAALRGQRETGRRIWERRLEHCRKVGDQRGEVDALLDLADLSANDGELDKAAQLATEAASLAEEHGFVAFEAVGYSILAHIACSPGSREPMGSPPGMGTPEASRDRALEFVRRAEQRVPELVQPNERYSVLRRCARVRQACADPRGALANNVAALQAAFDASLLYGVCTALREVATDPQSGLAVTERAAALAASLDLANETGAADHEATRTAFADLERSYPSECAEGQALAHRLGWSAVSEETIASLQSAQRQVSRP